MSNAAHFLKFSVQNQPSQVHVMYDLLKILKILTREYNKSFVVFKNYKYNVWRKLYTTEKKILKLRNFEWALVS